ncbi:glycosyltransferase family 1 protein [Bacteroides sp. OttesenSCG-928-D19]|nr:glycosyltransferase family 1 protein [Bacteroides sp. OttesenSCG-928-N06]MDL2304909.1 glycosyltransferase family 1 protein [Bacteroides sp. OttesenSCG-928-D19]
MKALFLFFHGFEEHNGISKKIRYQIQALRDCGLDTHVCYLNDINNHKYRMYNDEQVLCDYGGGIKGKVLKRIEFDSIVEYVKKERIEFIYLRYDHNANPFTIRLVKRLKKAGAQIAMEIPTYPYDHEYSGLPAAYQRILFFDKLYREKFAKYVDKIITFSDYDTIWGKPTIRISNGIDFSQIKLKKQVNDTSKEIHLIGVATMHPWHGFDRAIRGMINYYKQNNPLEVYFHVVGGGVPQVVEEYKRMVKENHLEKYVIFHNALFGEELDNLFEKSDIGIGSLARHRSNIDKIKTLKNREYAARGIPFVYSETDEDFENMPYIMKVPADESPLNIDNTIDFYRSVKLTPQEIRQTVKETLSWKVQMEKVIKEMSNLNPKDDES